MCKERHPPTCEQKGVALQPRHQLGRMRSLMGLPHVAQLRGGAGGGEGGLRWSSGGLGG